MSAADNVTRPADTQPHPPMPRMVMAGDVHLRDYFAAAALQGLCANPGGPIQANAMSGWGFCNCLQTDIAELAYALAGDMLKARGAA